MYQTSITLWQMQYHVIIWSLSLNPQSQYVPIPQNIVDLLVKIKPNWGSQTTIRSCQCAVCFLQIIHAGLPDPNRSQLAWFMQNNSRSHLSCCRRSMHCGQTIPFCLTMSCSGQHFMSDSLGLCGWKNLLYVIMDSLWTTSPLILIRGCTPSLWLSSSVGSSKTNPFGEGTRLYLGRTGNKPCPISAVLAYLAICPLTAGSPICIPGWGPIDQRKTGSTPTKSTLPVKYYSTSQKSLHTVWVLTTCIRAGIG